VAVVAGGGAQSEILEESLARGCETYVTGNAISPCPIPDVQASIAAFRALASEAGVSVVDGTHYGTEKPPQLAMADWFRARGVPADFVPGRPERE
jgi:putative NIF3 family GTP cyclohydrolase 1 type 2